MFFEKLAPCRIGREACVTAHHWARTLMDAGHEVRLIPPAYIKPYLRRQKNDAALYRMKKGTSDTPLASWARGLLASKPFKLVAVALANKIARIAWAIMTRDMGFQPDFTSGNSARVSASASA